jgi:hypothetical protein
MKASTGILTVLICTLNACGSNNSSNLPASIETKGNGSTMNTVASAPATTVPQSTATEPAVNIPLNLKGLNSLGSAGGSRALNPEHGKPGHRCDIAVGAPLNGSSSAAQQVTQPTAIPITQPSANIQAPVSLPLNATSTANTSASGLNPEHGKPGHRCDISVGAPLNSKTDAAAAAQPKAISIPLVTPVKAGMNPQHGQPGHRCDIAVGAPLNAKPTTPPVAKPAETPAAANSTVQ